MRSDSVTVMGLMAMLAGTASSAFAGGEPTGDICSLRLNEIMINTKGDDDQEWEFIEIFGQPNTSLGGLAIVVVNDEGSSAEVDESFVFPAGDKYRTDEDGYFILWNSSATSANPDTCAGASELWEWLDGNATITQGILVGSISSASIRFEAAFQEVGTKGDGGANDWPGKFNNDGSMSFLLISDWTSDAAIKKDASVNDSTTAGTPNFITNPAWVLDAVAYSDNGSEFVVLEGREFDYTSGFKPDALTRVDDVEPEMVYTDRYISGSEEFRDVYTNWIAGDLSSNDPSFNYDGAEAAGGVDKPAAMGTATQPTVNIGLTPSTINDTFNGRGGEVSTVCAESRGGADFDGNGVVNAVDLLEAYRTGDMAQVRTVLDAMTR